MLKNYFTLGYACLTWYAIYYFGYILTAHFYWSPLKSYYPLKTTNRKKTNKLSSHYYVLNLIHISPLCDQVCQWLATGRWFTWGTPVSSTNKTDHRDKTEILLKVVLNTIILTNSPRVGITILWWYRGIDHVQMVDVIDVICFLNILT